MINRETLLSDLQDLVQKLELDLIARSDEDSVPEVRDALNAEFKKATEAERTALSKEKWLTDYAVQMAAAWVLNCVFVRFLEDNQLIQPPRLSGPGDALQYAKDQHQVFISQHPDDSLREYLLGIFQEMEQLPGCADLFGKHNLVMQLPNWLSGDAAGLVYKFFQEINSDDGLLVHDFTDPEWDTRFLGDLYQDLSVHARKKYALLQTPDFVEEFILDRTLEPALDEFGLEAEPVKNKQGDEITSKGFRMIDPACGSGHFLLGSFPRILKRWQTKEPSTNIRELVQRTLDSIHGVDINPFAIAIARFRLLLVSLKASEFSKLADAPAFTMHLACGDSLYHGVGRQQVMEFTDEAHYFRTEDSAALKRILKNQTFHTVVANPPYITPKDRAANAVYRELYSTCHRKYALSVPFMQKIFQLAVSGEIAQGSGYTGQITANSFIKREFGKKLIENFLSTVDLFAVVDTSNAFIPGHATPTVIVFGRNRAPVSPDVRVVTGKAGESCTPVDPSKGPVWLAIVNALDAAGTENRIVSSKDISRETLKKHPWSLGGAAVSALKEKVEANASGTLVDEIDDIGVFGITAADEVMLAPPSAFSRWRIPSKYSRRLVVGDEVRDWTCADGAHVWFPYENEQLVKLDIHSNEYRWMWPFRASLWSRQTFAKKTYQEEGRTWWEWHQVTLHRLKLPLTITFPFVASHNHFKLDDSGCVFNRSVPIIKLDPKNTLDDYYAILGFLNSSIACFWLKQVSQRKQMSGGESIRIQDLSKVPFEYSTTQVKKIPIPTGFRNPELREQLIAVAKQLHLLGETLEQISPSKVIANALNNKIPVKEIWSKAIEEKRSARSAMILLQEELDFIAYRMFEVCEATLLGANVGTGTIDAGQRPFEQSFSTHPEGYEIRQIESDERVENLWKLRASEIDSSELLGAVEVPDYKRRWIGRQGKYNHTQRADPLKQSCESWMLDRLESYFDFDGRMKASVEDETQSREDERKESTSADAAPLQEIALYSVKKLADTAAADPQFMEIGEVYTDDSAFDVFALVDKLVKEEHVPLLPVLRYTDYGLRKRAEWEQVWQLQRLEDELRDGKPFSDPRVAALAKDCQISEEQQKKIEAWHAKTKPEQRTDTREPIARELDAILKIPVPPKYKGSGRDKDFHTRGGVKYWKLRGKLDVPKERWVSFPHCEGSDGSLMIAWAGYDHLQLARAISAHYVDVKNNLGGSDDPRLVPLLAGIMELLPWLHQWHSELDPEFDMRMNEYYDDTFVESNANELGKSREEIKNWKPT
ncbi:BREX-2 system adenine-specific DNA-methyltransferase PglX [Mariniblastus fucicola]|uniref:site-specific DNA-methyltransferase (adenine-specific) n=1 Tax=Mariniblastus fucicola TaxID=980251 RepID=A0A5B9PJB6_9BACT|nr:BREX-2 system adenine-specific DNA-methyltransferase PglX [Mariniblastus fucicola]QEG24772.1 hypothetical protein MFFC18_46950 [Mariniblastus fucicola]